MPLSSIPKVTNPQSASAPRGRSPFLIVFLSIMLAVYIGFISYWLINEDSNSNLAASSSAQLQTSAVTQPE